MDSEQTILGIDIGSVAISMALIDLSKKVIQTIYAFHYGDLATCLKKTLSSVELAQICAVAATSSTPGVIRADQRIDNRVAVIDACRYFHSQPGSILLVGGEKFGLIRFDRLGNYRNFKANTSCAAGTGSFLDQQARRLKLGGSAELGTLALRNDGPFPKIASRCAVFAKTDLVHAQQEGYTLEEICDGLCYGLAKNIFDTLFTGDRPYPPFVFNGGVAKNRAVVRHLQAMIGEEIVVERVPYGAVGAAFHLVDQKVAERVRALHRSEDLLSREAVAKKYFHPPLSLTRSDYPDFSSAERYAFRWKSHRAVNSVEIDIYENLLAGESWTVYIGIDIGSTSTKAVLMDSHKRVLAGLYTRTAGRPVLAVQNLLAAIYDLIQQKEIILNIRGVGTTGSGRKLSGKIIGADLVIDEITAHARAAYEINPDVDTIIEIGGQDSKFTTMKSGRVSFCAMNTVCAAGTGSFIEELAYKLDCRLGDYADRTENRRSPMVSDRCTVFMERDLNYYLGEGYRTDEVLASVLHSIRENYLSKVAVESSIGKVICFQGATAKNRALIAAFEQRIGCPIIVSKYCHLTGALGVAIFLAERGPMTTSFKGLDLYRKQIPIRSEICEFCANHCKITVADIAGEKVAYGFLCGRDYDTRKFISNNRSGFDLNKTRKKAFPVRSGPSKRKNLPTIGIPAGLYLYEDLPMWQTFFNTLNIPTVTSEGYNEAVKQGQHLAGAEFCAPMTALHGHVNYFFRQSNGPRADHIFLPYYFENKSPIKGVRRQYCYYSQYAASLCAAIGETGKKHMFLMPLIRYLYGDFHTKAQLYRMLKPIAGRRIRFSEVSHAYDAAVKFSTDGRNRLKEVYRKEALRTDDIHVVLLGRPYTVLPATMNKGIPGIFAALGVRAFFQDMIPYRSDEVAAVRRLVRAFHWHYAAQILEVTEKTARTPHAYPVLITSFKCSPDSFVTEYFKKLMESHEKPYLILQLDEHDSSVGYETRIEAAVRSFRNHAHSRPTGPSIQVPDILIPKVDTSLTDKTLLFPNWDSVSLRLVVAKMRREGIDARLLEETETGIQKSLRYNSGQCIPINIMAQAYIDYIENHRLDPARTVLWTGAGEIACNLKLIPHHIRYVLDAYGRGMEKASVYTGLISLADISYKLPVNTYFAYMFGGLVRKIGCRIRPYEKIKGETDRVINHAADLLEDAFLGNRPKTGALAEMIGHFAKIETVEPSTAFPRPQVAIFGDLYVRDNEVVNQHLIRFIEGHGGEVITTPYSSYVKMVVRPYLRKWFVEGHYLNVLSTKAIMATVQRLEKKYLSYFKTILPSPELPYDVPPKKILSPYNVRIENTGESMESLLKIFYIQKFYPDVALFVQLIPAFCCPSLVTEAMAVDIERNTGIPIVSITYDGTGGSKNDAVIPYLKYPRNRQISVAKTDRVKTG